jgi:hypothetical protein
VSPKLQHLVSCPSDNMHTSLHESIKTRFFLRPLDERIAPLSLGDKKALRLLARQKSALRRGCSGTKRSYLTCTLNYHEGVWSCGRTSCPVQGIACNLLMYWARASREDARLHVDRGAGCDYRSYLAFQCMYLLLRCYAASLGC